MPVLAVIGVSALLNLAAMVQGRVRVRLGERDAALYLGYDILQLAVLLFLTGGLQNPFAVLLLAPLTVSAIILSKRGTIILTALTLVVLALLAVVHYPLPGLPQPGGHERVALSPLYRLGVWGGLSLAAVFITGYVWQVADEARRIGDALAASQMALERERRLSALGALAAAAAHELGSPLSTIAVVARDLADELPPDSPLAEDAALVISQTGRCRDILANLARQPEAGGGDPYEQISMPALVEAAAQPYCRPGIDLEIEAQPRDTSRVPVLQRAPELMHGLGNLLRPPAGGRAHRMEPARHPADDQRRRPRLSIGPA